ncbi:hypothetical protein [Rhodohalobacter sp.]|uniref:hypothetical protein n=1 Tax=Rhodohalobacter sp. TaxID=1974210 RepID=UPI002ACEB9D1|nr:hypothetical protein [Rhodohalobacter sp.]
MKFTNVPISLFLSAALVAVFLSPIQCYSQGGYNGEFSRMGFSPIGLSMGNAMTASTRYSGHSYYNPAQAALQSSSIPLLFSSGLMQFDRQLHMVSVNFQLPPSAGLTFSLINARTGDIDGRNLSGYHTGYLSTSEYRLSGTFGIRFSEKVLAGLGINFNHSDFHEEVPAVQGIGIDLGIIGKISDRLNVGASIQNLLSSRSVNTSDLYGTESASNREKEPLRFLTGVTYILFEDLILHADYELRNQYGESVLENSGRNEIRSTAQFFRSGVDYSPHERISLRGGMIWNEKNPEQTLQPSAGFSVHLPFDQLTPSIDYAFVAEPSGISSMHVFGLRVNI